MDARKSISTTLPDKTTVIVVVPDRMGKDDPPERDWDLSRAAAKKLGMMADGVVWVTVQ